MTVVRRPLTARGVIASTLIGTNPPLLSARRLVRVGELFGINAGTIRVALSRMVVAGEVEKRERGYELVGHLLTRRDAQSEGRATPVGRWNRSWEMVAVTGTAGSSSARSNLRSSLTRFRLGELREGLWVRPANLDPDRNPTLRSHLTPMTTSFSGHPDDDPRALAARLWDLDEWSRDARELIASIEALTQTLGSVAGDDPHLLGPGFVESAAVLRLFSADPLLPGELEPTCWPAAALRSVYDDFDVAYRGLLLRWLDAA